MSVNMKYLYLFLFVLITSCKGRQPEVAGPPKPVTNQINEPLDRIPVRADVIKEQVPENKVVQTQATAILADVKEVKTGITKTEQAITRLQQDLTKERLESNKTYQSKVNWIRLCCIAGIGGGIIASVFLGRKFIYISVAAVTTLVAIAVEAFVWDWALPIAGVCLAIIAGLVIYDMFIKTKANKELVQTGEVLKKNLVKPFEEVKQEIVQSKTTKQIVDSFKEKK